MSGVQQVAMDTPDYSDAYELQAEQQAQNQGISQAAGMLSGAYAPVGQLGSMAGSVIRNRVKDKKKGAAVGGAVEMGASGAALGMSIAGPWGALAGGLLGAGYGAIKGKKDQEEVERKAKEQEEKTRIANINKTVVPGSKTDVQTAIGKKGFSKVKTKKKYKVKTKQPRMIETEGREPIFSPKKPDGSRDLLYYNPNDPTHEEGGVKAMVIPKAQAGKKKVKVEEEPQYLEDNDSIVEEIGELIDPTGISSYDDVYRSFVNLKNNKDRKLGDYVDLGLETLGAVPVIGKAGKLAKLGKYAFKYADKGLEARKIIQRANKIKDAGNAIRTSKVVKKSLPQTVKNVIKGARIGDRISDANTTLGLAKEFKGYENPEWERTHSLENAKFMGRKIFPKVSNENMYLNGTSKIMSGRKHSEIPEIEPPTPYELMPKPPRSRFNKDSKKVKVYR